MSQLDAYQATYNKSPDDIVMNGETYQELKKELRADDPAHQTYGVNQTYGISISTIMGIRIYINEAVSSSQMFFRSEGLVKSVVSLVNIGKPSKLSKFAKKRMIRITNTN
jgi:hypothetical protein